MFRKRVPKTQRACEGKSRVDIACIRWVDSKYQNWNEQGMLQVTCRKSEIHRGARKGVHHFKGWSKYLFPHLQRNRLLSTPINQRVSKMPQHLKDKPLFWSDLLGHMGVQGIFHRRSEDITSQRPWRSTPWWKGCRSSDGSGLRFPHGGWSPELHTVDGCESLHQLRGGKHPMLFIGLQPPKLVQDFFHHSTDVRWVWSGLVDLLMVNDEWNRTMGQNWLPEDWSVSGS